MPLWKSIYNAKQATIEDLNASLFIIYNLIRTLYMSYFISTNEFQSDWNKHIHSTGSLISTLSIVIILFYNLLLCLGCDHEIKFAILANDNADSNAFSNLVLVLFLLHYFIFLLLITSFIAAKIQKPRI